MAFPPLGNSDHVVVSVSIDFPTNSQQDVRFHRIAYDYSRADWDGLRDHLRDVPWEDIFKFGASAAASEFGEWIRVGIDAYIPHRKYQVKSHSSPWFSAACAAAIVHRNHFFRLYQREKSSDSKVKFRQASNRCKSVLEAAKLAYANKRKESITSRKLGSRVFWRIANSVLNKDKSGIPPLFNGPEVLSSASNKAKLFAEIFSLNSNLDDSGVSLPVFPSRTNLKLHNISITPKMVRKVVMNLDLSKASGPDCIPVVVLKICEPELSYILAELFNKCLKESCFPDCWMVSSVVPVFKNVGERSTAKNYCPVSLLSVVSKVFEKLVNNRIVDHPEKCGLFSDLQYGCRSSRSTADLLTIVSDRIARAFNRSGATRAVALDISKDFDRVWHAGAPSCYLDSLDKLQKQICRIVGPSFAASLEPLAHRQNVTSLSLFYRYYFGRCSSELAQLVPVPFFRGRSTRYSDRLHDFSVTIPRCYKDVYVKSFFPCTAKVWNSLPIECVPLTYDLSGFKFRINGHL